MCWLHVQASWTVPPFAAEEINGRVYGRGAQDMKCVCVQYLIAIHRLRLRLQGVSGGNSDDNGNGNGNGNATGGKGVPLRTVRLAWVPDEEVGGADGMGVLLQSQWFKEVPVGLALDEVVDG
jgi:aminoacylase